MAAHEYYTKQKMEPPGSQASWNARDQHMATTLLRLREQLDDPKIIVWAHNSHIGDSTACPTGGVKNCYVFFFFEEILVFWAIFRAKLRWFLGKWFLWVTKFVQTDWSDFVKFWIYSKIENSEKTILTVLEFYFDKFLIDFWKIDKNLIKNRVFKP